jgi:opacity protein-like surface antigen
MKKTSHTIYTIITALLFCIFYKTAFAAERPFLNYIAVDVGGSFPLQTKDKLLGKHKPDKSFIAGIKTGYVFNNTGISADINYVRIFNSKAHCKESNCFATQNFSSDLLLLNGYYNLFNYKNAGFYINGGIGAAHTKTGNFTSPTLNNYYKGGDNMTFTWSTGASISYSVSENLLLDLRYSYYNLGPALKSEYKVYKYGLSESKFKVRFNTQTVTLGMRYRF